MKPAARNISPLPPVSLGASLWTIASREALADVVRLARSLPVSLLGPVPPQVAATVVDQPPPSGPGIAVITLCGVLTPHGSYLSWLFGGGGGGVQAFRDSLARAVNDPEVAAIVIDVDSPGGSVGLVPEAAADVRAARDVKPVYAVANTLAASGAYWIAAQATEFYATKSGMVGSVGVYYVHEDYSKWNADLGLDVTYIFAGKYKTEGNPDQPLTDEAKAAWQADADKLYGQFVADVAAGRGVSAAKVRSDFGEGRTFLADDALAAGMVDGVETLQEVIERALNEARTSVNGPTARRLGRADHRVPLPRAEANASGDGDDPDAEESEEQARCSCGKYLADDESQCDACKAAAESDDTDEEDEDLEDDLEDLDDDEDDPDDEEDDEEDKNTSPPDPDAAAADRRLRALAAADRAALAG